MNLAKISDSFRHHLRLSQYSHSEQVDRLGVVPRTYQPLELWGRRRAGYRFFCARGPRSSGWFRIYESRPHARQLFEDLGDGDPIGASERGAPWNSIERDLR